MSDSYSSKSMCATCKYGGKKITSDGTIVRRATPDPNLELTCFRPVRRLWGLYVGPVYMDTIGYNWCNQYVRDVRP